MDHPAVPTEPIGSVMVEIGLGHGALVVRTPAALHGREIEISPLEAPRQRRHVEVLPRALAAGIVHAAVFPSLPTGPYLVWDPCGGLPRRTRVAAARVTELDW